MTEPSSPLLKALTLEGFLSFGRGAGSVLRAVPRDLPLPIRQGGRVRDWLWTVDPSTTTTGPGVDSPSARTQVVFAEGRIARFHTNPAVRYRLVSWG